MRHAVERNRLHAGAAYRIVAVVLLVCFCCDHLASLLVIGISLDLTLTLASRTNLLPLFFVSHIPAKALTVVQRDGDVLIAVAFGACDHSASTMLIRSPIQRMTGTAMLFPIAL